jgi:glycosyltransferase involved in cell wall biosynthesis
MRIGIDARMLGWSGVGRYTENLLQGLAEVDKENEYIVFKKIPFPPFSFGEQFLFPLILRKKKIDLFHSPHFLNPLMGVKKLVLTVHDLIPLHFPQYFSLRERFYFYQVLKRGIKRAGKIITVSQHTKRDVLNNFKVEEEKVKVIPNAVSKMFHPIDSPEKIEKFKEKHSIDKPYILYVGNRKSHKNLEKLFQAFGLLREKTKESHILVIASLSPRTGKPPAQQNLPNSSIKFLENISDEDLPLLYNGAEVFAFPSLYEGFGLPPVEAMACGTPVITSNTTSLPEVVGEAAITVDPRNSEEMARGIWKILENRQLRSSLVEKGLARVKLFSVNRLAKETFRVYKEVASSQ